LYKETKKGDVMDNLTKLIKGRAGLILRQGFFAPFVLRMPLVESPDLPKFADGCKTMATDGKRIYWYPEFVESCTDEQVEFALAHEGLHPAFLHHLRKGERDHERWNEACDYAINPILRNAGFVPPPDILFNYDYDDKSAEWIYDRMPKETKKSAGWNIGGVIPFKGKGGKPTPEEIKIHEQQWITEFVSAAQTAKSIGTLPAGLDRLITEMLTPKINWKAVLQRFLTAMIKNDYNWNRPNRRYINQGLYLPHLQSPAIGNGVIFMDTSGSVGGRELNQLGSESKAITDAYAVDLDIIYVDSEVAGHDHIEAINPHFNLEPKGGGGTSFVPGFKYVEEQGIQPKFALYLTDGGSHDFPESPPPYPLIWVLTEEYHGFNPPFGEILIMPEERI
jgi:predicted metal-dependent peptidase